MTARATPTDDLAEAGRARDAGAELPAFTPETMTYEQDLDGGGNPVPGSYSIFYGSGNKAVFVAQCGRESDARRFVVAPDLYAALKDMLRIARIAGLAGESGYNDQRIAAAEAALAKAEGRS